MPRRRRHKNPELLILSNPLRRAGRWLRQALRAYERFHWRKPVSITQIQVPEGIAAKALVRIGAVDEIRYSTSDDSERTKVAKLWAHIFKDKPHLLTTPKGDVIIICGGGLHVTPRGIEG